MPDRRHASRVPIDILFNKYVNGYPRLCRGTNLSRTGLLATLFLEPDCAAESATIEFRLPGDRDSIWAWAQTVRAEGRQRALKFRALHHQDQRRLDAYLARTG
jgi:hypothetical protein